MTMTSRPKYYSLLLIAAVVAAAAAAANVSLSVHAATTAPPAAAPSSSVPPTDAALLLPSLPSLPALPPLDLSPEGLQQLLKVLLAAITGGEEAASPEKPLLRLFELLADLLKEAEGLLLPPKAQGEAQQLTETLRKVFRQQSVLREKLTALQQIARDDDTNTIEPPERQSLKDIAQKLWQQYKALEEFGMKILQQLAQLLRGLLLPNLKQPEKTAAAHQQQQQQQQELLLATDHQAVFHALQTLFPDLLD